ncbi:adenosine deaminase 2-like [Vanessa cardui]|uniref:adenosine deaminase 2-like n=1 Tax=Vanessa cardui TaxID=171605 RepID=UPI001F14357A|nr:adenosine deaminase 2-like [Vanessa cardui]
MYAAVIKYVILTLCAQTIARSIHDYNAERANLLEQEFELQVGGNIKLSDKENSANDVLMRHKQQELDESFQNPKYFNFSRHYFTYKNDIEKSKVYQIIRRMPKGAALHVHSSLMLSAERLLALTYEDHLHACFADDDLKLHFSINLPQRPCQTEWRLLSVLRNETEDIASFDENIKKHFTLYSENEEDLKYDINHVWERFDKVCHTIKDLIAYRPVREKFFYEALKEFYNDKVMYIELRSGLPVLYELDGTLHDLTHMPRIYHRVAKRFKEDHPDFIGIKLIVTMHRAKDINKIRKSIELARRIKEELPDMFAGFDLVGQEDLGKPLVDFLPALTEAKDDINYYFHGGETNWFGSSTDENLADAILLGSKRIGHGYALIKHPSLLAAVKAKDIALEVNVISNVVLSLVSDVRNHPLASYLAFGMPVVLSSDDPGAWGADPLSHDFYISFVGIASKRADLRMLKQLVINSIKYSTLDPSEKLDAFKIIFKQWDDFIEDLNTNFR